ncbi:MAG: HRDC domain-containing protein [Chthoniobacteraceae bacterium]|nr:HRDC domain-containing protein [Chthoniobacteraceae bacterium]
MIVSSEALAEFLEPLHRAGRIGLDTEADSLHCYFEKLCLIQISIPDHDVLIDPLAGFPLDPLFAELARHEIIIQGLDYDLRLLRRAGMTEVGGVFDTMIAARLLGATEFSLAALLHTHFGVVLAKGSQKANWARRPLSPQMEEYARNDTRHLEALAAKLEEGLRELGRVEWFRQSCEKGIEATRIVREREEDTLWRISGSGELRGRAAALLRELWKWRDAEARAVDRPAFHIARNDLLIDAAKRFAAGDPVPMAHLSGGRRRRFFEAAERALALPESEWPQPLRTRRARPTPEMERRFADFKTRRDHAATVHRIEPSLIAPKSMLETLAADTEATLEKLLPWQRLLLGFEG